MCTTSETLGLIVNTLRNYPNLSRAELTTMLSLSPATLTHHVRDLIDAGWVEEQHVRRTSGGGRPRVGLALRNTATYAVTMTFSPTSLTAAVIDFGGHIVAKTRVEQPMGHVTDAMATVDRVLHDLVRAQEEKFPRFAGIGLAIPGIWDPESETVVFTPNLPEWVGMKLRDLIQRHGHDEPVFIANDADAGAWGELWFGAGRDVQDMMYVLYDIGIGAGIIIQRQLIRAQNNSIGEIGHMFVDSSNKDIRCGCGQYGCLEALGSLTALQHYQDQGMELPQTLDKISRYLSIGLGGLINVFSPQIIVFSSHIFAHYPSLWPSVVRNTRGRLLQHLVHKTQFLQSPLDDNASLLGLAGLLFEQELTRSQGQTVTTVNPSQWLIHPASSPAP